VPLTAKGLQLSEKWKYRLLVEYPHVDWLRRNLSLRNWWTRITTSQRIRQLVRLGKPIYLNVGCARTRLAGWVHGDIFHGEIYLDATKRLPFPDNSVDLVFSEHFIEHIKLREAQFFLRECHRVLRPGGSMRHSTPDLQFYVNLYLGQTPGVTLDHFWARARHIRPVTPPPAVYMNEILRLYGHRFIFDFDYLASLCRDAGFVGVKRVAYGESEIAQFSGLEQHSRVEWFRYQATLVFEATKPGIKQD
jgi:SAM-dependent methyltransferase